jgi:hypothetical protein
MPRIQGSEESARALRVEQSFCACLVSAEGSALCGDARGLGQATSPLKLDRQKLEKRYSVLRRRAVPFQSVFGVGWLSFVSLESPRNGLSRGG